jgi:hypothetical protein
MLGEVVDIVASISEQALLTVYEADTRAAGNDTLETGRCSRRFSHFRSFVVESVT